MDTITIKIDMSNAAFADEARGVELARILRRLSGELEAGNILASTDPYTLRDINGNPCGTVQVK